MPCRAKQIRILIAGVNYAPEVTGIAPFTTGLAEHLAERGHEVTVATTFPFAPHWRWFRPPPRWRTRERLNGVDVWRTKVVLPKRRSTLGRIVFDSSVGLSSASTAVSIPRVDIAICLSPPIQTALAIAALRFKLGKLVILVQDLPSEAARSIGMLKTGIALRAGRSLERYAYGLAEHIVVISSSFSAYIEGIGVNPTKITEIPNWAEVEAIRPSPPDQEMRLRLGAGPKDFLVVYTGNMGAKQDLLNVVSAAALLKSDAQIKIALIGDGQERDKVAREISTKHLDNIRLLPLQPKHQFSSVLTSADLLLINQAPGIIGSVLPSKLLAYMASGRPVVAAANPKSTTADLVLSARCGTVTEPGLPEALAAEIELLASGGGPGKALTEMGRSGRVYVEEHFDRRSILRRWETLIADVVGIA